MGVLQPRHDARSRADHPDCGPTALRQYTLGNRRANVAGFAQLSGSVGCGIRLKPLSKPLIAGSFKGLKLIILFRPQISVYDRNGPHSDAADEQRVVITSIGLTAPNGANLEVYRENLLKGVSGVRDYEIRYVGKTLAGVCDFEATRYQSKKDIRRGTRAGAVGIYATAEAVARSGLDWANVDKSRVGIYIGVTEHGNVETENEIYNIKGFDYDTQFWSHHHNPRTVANNPAGEVALNLGITGPHYTIGAACAAGNAGIIQGVQMLRLQECDIALAGGVSESIHTFGIFASFKSQGALATHDDPTKASRPFDVDRNGIVVSEGACMYVLERLSDAKARNADIIAEIVSYAINTDATDFVLPNPERQAQCVQLALQRGGLSPEQIDIVSTHATGTSSGDAQETTALRKVFSGSG